jgi:hypothetical protein
MERDRLSDHRASLPPHQRTAVTARCGDRAGDRRAVCPAATGTTGDSELGLSLRGHGMLWD